MMKAIKCELCGSNELRKQDGEYVCQYCGTRYTTEEAKKLIVEGEVTLKIDNTEKVASLIKLAARYYQTDNASLLADVSGQMLSLEPGMVLPQILVLCAQGMMGNRNAMLDAAPHLLPVIADDDVDALPDQVRAAAKSEFGVSCAYDELNLFAEACFKTLADDYNGAAHFALGNRINEVFEFEDPDDAYSMVEAWKLGCELYALSARHVDMLMDFEAREMNATIDGYRHLINQYDPSWKGPKAYPVGYKLSSDVKKVYAWGGGILAFLALAGIVSMVNASSFWNGVQGLLLAGVAGVAAYYLLLRLFKSA